MGAFEVRKASDNANNGFNETVEYKVLNQNNVETNHNKFYCLEIQKNSKGEYRIFTHYGRLGSSNIYEIRDKCEGKPITDFDAVKKEFDSIFKKKLKGKRNSETGEMEAYVEVDVVAPTVGSENIRHKSEKKVVTSSKAAIDVSGYDPMVSKLLDQLIDENVHNITSNTSIKYTATGGFATELGPVTPSHIAKARQPLDELNKLMGTKGEADASNRDVIHLNSLFFSLIPKPFSRKITEADMILDANALQAEYDILDQLATGVQMGSAMGGSAAQRMNALGTEVEILKDKAERERITNYIVRSKAANHQGSDVWGFKVRQIYQIKIPDERNRYERTGKSLGSIQEVFHGSANSNLLSILKGGLIIPPCSAPHVCGRMFGNGIYGANNSTKSLNYSIGYWGAKRSKYGNAFLFLADFAMGKYYTVQSSVNSAPKGYDSIWAKKGSSLYNDELIVPTLPQCTLKYMVEMTK